MDNIKNQFTIKNLIQFVKLQLAGNILFWGTLIGSFVFHELLHWTEFIALVTASVISHILFFIADKEWVFNEGKDGRKTSDEIGRFVIFMGMNFFINLGIVTGVDAFLDKHPITISVVEQLNRTVDFNLYLGQFAAAMFFTFWTYLGLKFWVFRGSARKKRDQHGERKPAK